MSKCSKCGDPNKEKGFCPTCKICPNGGEPVIRESNLFRCKSRCGFVAEVPPEDKKGSVSPEIITPAMIVGSPEEERLLKDKAATKQAVDEFFMGDKSPILIGAPPSNHPSPKGK